MGKTWGEAGLEWKAAEWRRHVMFRHLLDTQIEMSPLQLEIRVWSYRQESGKHTSVESVICRWWLRLSERVCGEEKSLLFRHLGVKKRQRSCKGAQEREKRVFSWRLTILNAHEQSGKKMRMKN